MESKLSRLHLDDDAGNSRPGFSKFITIPHTAVGKLIGKGGSNIKSLQSKSGAKIKIVDCQVTITGDGAQVKMAEKLIQNLVEELSLKTIRIAQSQIGLLIGTKGGHIRHVRETSGATVKINQSGGSNSDALVDISGTKDQICLAEKLIAKTISKADPITEMTLTSGSDGKPKFAKTISKADPITEMTLTSGSDGKPKLVLKQLDKGVKEKDLLEMYPDANIRPNIVIRVEKTGVTNYATLTFGSKGESEIWMHQVNGKMILGRRIRKADTDMNPDSLFIIENFFLKSLI